MNDRFKFRVWNKKYNCYDFCKRKFGILYIQEKFRVSSGYDGEDHPTFCEDVNENYIIEQCTGLKDKNGNLIYEGDIIKDRGGITYKIQWKDACFLAVALDNFNYMPDCMLVQTWLNTWKAEIVENIHENKGE